MPTLANITRADATPEASKYEPSADHRIGLSARFILFSVKAIGVFEPQAFQDNGFV
jgi:hypothetical protein